MKETRCGICGGKITDRKRTGKATTCTQHCAAIMAWRTRLTKKT